MKPLCCACLIMFMAEQNSALLILPSLSLSTPLLHTGNHKRHHTQRTYAAQHQDINKQIGRRKGTQIENTLFRCGLSLLPTGKKYIQLTLTNILIHYNTVQWTCNESLTRSALTLWLVASRPRKLASLDHLQIQQ